MVMSLASRLQPNAFTLLHDSSYSPKISLLVPLFQQSKLVISSLSSILSQRDVACEIIVSDDCSNDNSFEIALGVIVDYIKSGKLDHRIIVRKGSSRLSRDHIHLLAANASADIVAQFHCDDLFDEYRAYYLYSSIVERGCSCVASTHLTTGLTVQASYEANWNGLRRLSNDEVIRPHLWPEWLIGSSQCWKISHLARFDALTMKNHPWGHDRIIPFRSNLLGGTFAIAEALYTKRFHPEMWSLREFSPDKIRTSHKSALINLTIFSSMLNDLDSAKFHGLCDLSHISQCREIVLEELVKYVNYLRDNTGFLMAKGLENRWIDPALIQHSLFP